MNLFRRRIETHCSPFKLTATLTAKPIENHRQP